MKEAVLRIETTSRVFGARMGFVAAAFALLAVFALHAAFFAPAAWADDLSDVQAELDSKVSELEALAERVNDSGEEIAGLEDEIKGLLADIEKGQVRHAKLKQKISWVSKAIYKNGDQLNIVSILTNAESFSQVMEQMEIRQKVLSEYVRLSAEQQKVATELEVSYRTVSQQKDEQAKKLADLKAQQDELDQAVSALQSRADELSAAQQAALAAAAEAERQAAEAEAAAVVEPQAPEKGDSKKAQKEEKSQKEEKAEPEPEPEPEPEAVSGGWQTGVASAYGGSSDDSVGNDAPTATGSIVDDYSMGVAVPIAWGPENYYGRSVEISYGGVTVVATVTDCGGMGDGARALDLQPGVFKAFGASTCDDWGVREVQYRFL